MRKIAFRSILFAALAIVAGGMSPIQANPIEWGNFVSLNQTNYNSAGGMWNTNYTFSLGTFGTGFAPEIGNVDMWVGNWKQIDTAAYNPTFDYFTKKTTLADNSVFASGERAYIWIYNSTERVSGTEWLLLSDDTWNIPTVDDNQQNLPLLWRTTQAGNLYFGAKDNLQGNGHYSNIPNNFSLQTHTFEVPEPSTAGMSALVLAAAFFRRKRNRIPRQYQPVNQCSGPFRGSHTQLDQASL
jgi:hypothetical protein